METKKTARFAMTREQALKTQPISVEFCRDQNRRGIQVRATSLKPAFLDRFLQWSKSLALLLCLLLSASSAVATAADRAGYAGLEFFGSSQISRVELDKTLRLKPGATVENGEKALMRLLVDLEKRHLKTNSELIPAGEGNYFIVVDVVDAGLSDKLPTRRLANPHHIALKNEKPFQLLAELRARLTKLQEEGRPASEDYKEGLRYFSDVPATRIAERIIQEMDGQERGVYTLLGTDPNGQRRADAIDLLNWTYDYENNCRALILALDDSDALVRAAAAKYFWSHINLLPENFPYDALCEALSRQLSRPSYHDRVRAMAALTALAKHDSDSISSIKTFDEERLKEIAGNSIIPNVQKMASTLLAGTANPPPIKRVKRRPVDVGTGF